MLFKQVQDLGPTLLPPLFNRLDRLTFTIDQWIGQSI
jgi:hypothetical protein